MKLRSKISSGVFALFVLSAVPACSSAPYVKQPPRLPESEMGRIQPALSESRLNTIPPALQPVLEPALHLPDPERRMTRLLMSPFLDRILPGLPDSSLGRTQSLMKHFLAPQPLQPESAMGRARSLLQPVLDELPQLPDSSLSAVPPLLQPVLDKELHIPEPTIK